MLFVCLLLAKALLASSSAREACLRLHSNPTTLTGQYADIANADLQSQIELLCKTLFVTEDSRSVPLRETSDARNHFLSHFNDSLIGRIRQCDQPPSYPGSFANDVQTVLDAVDIACDRVLREVFEFNAYVMRSSEMEKVIARILALDHTARAAARQELANVEDSKAKLSAESLRFKSNEFAEVAKQYLRIGVVLEAVFESSHVPFLRSELASVQQLLTMKTPASITDALKNLSALEKQVFDLSIILPGVSEIKSSFKSLRDKVDIKAEGVFRDSLKAVSDITRSLKKNLQNPRKQQIVEHFERIRTAMKSLEPLQHTTELCEAAFEKISNTHAALAQKIDQLKREAPDTKRSLGTLKSEIERVLDLLYDHPDKVYSVERDLEKIQDDLVALTTDENAPLFRSNLQDIRSLLREALDLKPQAHRVAARVLAQVKKSDREVARLSKTSNLADGPPLEALINENSVILREFPAGRLIELQNILIGILDRLKRTNASDGPLAP